MLGFSPTAARAAVDRSFASNLAFLQELVRTPSLLGQEEPAQRLVEERLVDLGFHVTSVEPDPEALAELADSGIPLLSYEGRRSIVGTRRGTGGRSLLFNGHVDVVSEAPADRWTKPPYAAVIEDGRLYGRGACDMKGGIVAMLLAIEAAGDDAGDIVVHSVIEEECGGNGALAACFAGPGADGVVIAEPTNGGMDLVAPGVIWARVAIEGRSRHASHADEGSNPIETAFAVTEALHELEASLNAEPEREFEGIERPYLLNVGALHAGDWPSITPGRAVLDVRLGFPIRMDPTEAQARLAESVREADAEAEVEFRGFRARGYAFPADSPLVGLLSECH
jgi:acetylornithine deacetylase